MYTDNPIFDRARLLMGDDVMQTIASRRVIIFGVGGVGSWVAECLIRSGIRHLTIVDSDRICASNVNRQLMATSLTVGEVKVDALRRHLLEISPDADILALQKIYSADTADDFALDTYDYIIDAIDSLKDKALLMLRACETRATLFSSMGAALKMDPTQIRVARQSGRPSSRRQHHARHPRTRPRRPHARPPRLERQQGPNQRLNGPHHRHLRLHHRWFGAQRHLHQGIGIEAPSKAPSQPSPRGTEKLKPTIKLKVDDGEIAVLPFIICLF